MILDNKVLYLYTTTDYTFIRLYTIAEREKYIWFSTIPSPNPYLFRAYHDPNNNAAVKTVVIPTFSSLISSNMEKYPTGFGVAS